MVSALAPVAASIENPSYKLWERSRIENGVFKMASVVGNATFSKTAVSVLPENKIAQLALRSDLRLSKSSPWVQTWLTSERRGARSLRKSVSFVRQSDVSATGASLYLDDERPVEEETRCLASAFPIHPLA